jgi:type I restriction enzyme S subunit
MTFSNREVSIGEVCEIKQGRYLAPNEMEENPTEDSPVPVIGGNGILGYTNQSTFSFPVPLVTCRGSRCGLMQWAEPPTWISNNAMAVYFKDGEGDNFFLHQYLLNLSFEDVTTGSAQPQITVTNLSSKRLLLPDFETQTAISKILRNIEGKIAINNALSKTLEDIAQTIFKSWFIDFDPVKAKMNGEKPVGMDAETAAHFPDSFEESELGLIPKGWEVKCASELFEVGIGRTPPRKETEWFCGGSDGVPWVSIRDMGTFETYSHDTNEALTLDAVKRFKVPLVPENTVLMSFKLTVGKLCITDRELVTNEAIAHFRITNESPIESFYTYLWLRNIEMGNLDSTSSIGTATNSGVIKQIEFLVPTKRVLACFLNTVNPVFNELKALRRQSSNLIQLRDSLLPRLISGELQIPEEMLAS